MNFRLLSFSGLLLLSLQLTFVAQAAPVSADALKAAQKALSTAPVPAGVRPEIWKEVVQQLNGSGNDRWKFFLQQFESSGNNNYILDLENWNLTSAELAAIINALPPVIKKSIIFLRIP